MSGRHKKVCGRDQAAGVGSCWWWWEGCPETVPDCDVRRRRDLYQQARTLVLTEQNASPSFIQRKLQVGYSDALAMVQEMEREGICAPVTRSGVRKMLRAAQ